jgi:antirestriction protein
MNGGEHEQDEQRHAVGSEQPAEALQQERQPDDELLGRAMPGLPPERRPGIPRPPRPEEREGEDEQPSPRIYVASLSDYNAGRLHGEWIAADQALDDVWSEIGDMLAESPEPGAEEWAIHDYEGFGPLRLREYESLDLVSEIAQGIAEHGEAFAAFVELAERDPDRFPFFEDLYKGKWESRVHYAEALLQELGADDELARLPEWLRNNVMVHVEGFADELEANGSVMTMDASDGGVYVFDFEA